MIGVHAAGNHRDPQVRRVAQHAEAFLGGQDKNPIRIPVHVELVSLEAFQRQPLPKGPRGKAQQIERLPPGHGVTLMNGNHLADGGQIRVHVQVLAHPAELGHHHVIARTLHHVAHALEHGGRVQVRETRRHAREEVIQKAPAGLCLGSRNHLQFEQRIAQLRDVIRVIFARKRGQTDLVAAPDQARDPLVHNHMPADNPLVRNTGGKEKDFHAQS